MFAGHFLFSFLLFSSPFQNGADSAFRVSENLDLPVEVFDGNSFSDKIAPSTKAVHLPLDLSRARGRFLLIESERTFYVFINSAFAQKGQHQLRLSADSLRRALSSTVFLSVYEPGGVEDLSIKWISPKPPDELY